MHTTPTNATTTTTFLLVCVLTTMFTTQQDSLRARETAPQSLPRRGSAGAAAVHRYQILKSPLYIR